MVQYYAAVNKVFEQFSGIVVHVVWNKNVIYKYVNII